MKKLITLLILISATLATATPEGNIRLRFRTDKFDAMTVDQTNSRWEMVAEIYDWENPNRLHYYPVAELGVPTKLQFGAYVDKWTVCTQDVNEVWVPDPTYPETKTTDQWTCFYVSNRQTGEIGTFTWAQMWRALWTFLNPYFKIDRTDAEE